MVVLRRRDMQLHEDALDVLLDRALGDEEPLGDGTIGPALGHGSEDLTLAVGEVVDWIVTGPSTPDQLSHDRRIEGRPSLADAMHRIRELVQVGNAVLQQVPPLPSSAVWGVTPKAGVRPLLFGA
jgi:hypothetical protein